MRHSVLAQTFAILITLYDDEIPAWKGSIGSLGEPHM